MSTREHLHSVVTSLQPVIQGVRPDGLEDVTPCEDWTVGRLINHMLGTVEAMRRVGAGESLDPDDPWGTGGDHLSEHWQSDLAELLSRFADAWQQPASWEGEAMDGAMPRALVGDMGFVEVMLHGWDLARASGQDVEYDDAAAERAREVMEKIGADGRRYGAFGDQVEVPDGAPPFAHALGMAGRDPEWQA